MVVMRTAVFLSVATIFLAFPLLPNASAEVPVREDGGEAVLPTGGMVSTSAPVWDLPEEFPPQNGVARAPFPWMRPGLSNVETALQIAGWEQVVLIVVGTASAGTTYVNNGSSKWQSPIVSTVSLTINDCIKGPQCSDNATIVITLPGGALGNRRISFSDSLYLAPGHKYLLFLTADGQRFKPATMNYSVFPLDHQGSDLSTLGEEVLSRLLAIGGAR